MNIKTTIDTYACDGDKCYVGDSAIRTPNSKTRKQKEIVNQLPIARLLKSIPSVGDVHAVELIETHIKIDAIFNIGPPQKSANEYTGLCGM